MNYQLKLTEDIDIKEIGKSEHNFELEDIMRVQAEA